MLKEYCGIGTTLTNRYRLNAGNASDARQYIKKGVYFNKMANNDTRFKTIQIYKRLHIKIGSRARLEEVKMKFLASEIIDRMFKSHEDEIKEIIKEIKMKKT